MKSKQELRKVFENGDKPKQEDFWEWQDSFWHKEDEGDIIPANRVDLSKKADLVNGKVPSEQLPSYVDDILEYDAMEDFPINGEVGKLFLAKNSNRLYRWSGSQYVDITPSEADTLDRVSLRGSVSSTSISIKDSSKASLNYVATPSVGADSNIYFGGMSAVATGGGNSSFSAEGLKVLSSGDYNSSFGWGSLQTLTTGRGNVAIGAAMTGNAGGNITGKHNVCVGTSAGNNIKEDAQRNVLVGSSTGSYITSGKDNVMIGYGSGIGISSGNNNVFIGARAGGTSTNAAYNFSNKLCIHSIPSTTSSNFWDNATPGHGHNDYSTGLITGDFVERWVKFNGKFIIGAGYMPSADASYTKNIVANPDGTFGWEDKKALEINASKGTTFPSTSNSGDLFFNTSDNKHYGFDGTNWNALY
ncbi:hypothetical protein [Cloacibacterium sp. TD35]|uniref:hypothetical protein n=1 Tax=Cloacibacterium sp. TD35 TaxID=2976818 RepID=UPI00237D9606|nr:hypothetical protein [Cloacibacterium sp. TD35]WDT68025.1 hypothetical protein N7277_00020 [Cloacibacterium sp. TD35]